MRPRVILLENVEEFRDWGPLLADGRICPKRRGTSFRRWLSSLERAGYQVEMRELRACDYGAPTIRKRLFIIARCDGQPIVWPAPTHGPGRAFPYRVAAECIQWELACPSIFDRKKPLAEKTLRRIARGIQRFVIDAAEPFIVPLTHGRQNDSAPHSVETPLRTVTGANRGELALVTPSLIQYHSATTERAHRVRELTEPLPVQDTSNRFALVAPTLVQTGYGERPGQAPRALDIQRPLGTIIAGGTGGNGKHALVGAFLAKHYGDPERASGGGAVVGSDVTTPIGTVTSRDHHTLVTTHMLKLRGTCADGQTMDRPAPTVTASGTHLGEVRAFLTKYYGTAVGEDPQLPLGTVTTRDRFGVVYVHGEPYAIADIGMRMLAPRELFRAQSFPDSYVIDPFVDKKTKRGKTVRRRLTKTEQIRMCGNSVCPVLAAVLAAAQFAPEQAVAA